MPAGAPYHETSIMALWKNLHSDGDYVPPRGKFKNTEYELKCSEYIKAIINVELKVNPDKLAMPEFQALWSKINARTAYVVDFDTDELVRKAVAALDSKLRVPKIFFKVETGSMKEIKSKDDLLAGSSFEKQKSGTYDQHKVAANTSVKYDLVGKLVEETGLTRKAVIQILTGI